MNLISLIGVELKKIRRSKILLILLIPVVIMWIPGILNADISFDTRGIPITPENNFFIQGFMGMVWFMIPASLVVTTVLLTQTEALPQWHIKNACPPGEYGKALPGQIRGDPSAGFHPDGHDHPRLLYQRGHRIPDAGL